MVFEMPAILKIRLKAECPTHSRTEVSARQHKVLIDEPPSRNGTDMAQSPLETLMSSVRHPDPVRCIHVELPIQRVVDDHGRLAAIAARPTLVADPGPDAGQPGKARNPVRADRLALIQQVIV